MPVAPCVSLLRKRRICSEPMRSTFCCSNARSRGDRALPTVQGNTSNKSPNGCCVVNALIQGSLWERASCCVRVPAPVLMLSFYYALHVLVLVLSTQLCQLPWQLVHSTFLAQDSYDLHLSREALKWVKTAMSACACRGQVQALQTVCMLRAVNTSTVRPLHSDPHQQMLLPEPHS
jgi:hypothetical protein